MVFPPNGGDFNDLHIAEGLDAVQAQVVGMLGLPEPGGGVIRLSDWVTSKRFTGTPPEREWLVSGAFPIGKPALLAAAGGVGKSFLLLELAYRVAASNPGGLMFAALGRVDVEGAAVLICAEDDAIEVHNRLVSLGGPVDRLIVVPLPDAGGARPLFSLDEKGRTPATTMHFHQLAEQLRAIKDLRLCASTHCKPCAAGWI